MGAFDHLSDNDPRVIEYEERRLKSRYESLSAPFETYRQMDTGGVVKYGQWYAVWQDGSWNIRRANRTTPVDNRPTYLMDSEIQWPEDYKKEMR